MNRPPKGDDYRRGNSANMMFQPSAQDNPNMTIKIKQGSYWLNGTDFVEFNGGSSPIIEAPRSGAKWVVVVINKLGTILIVNGIAKANNPELPELSRNLLPVACVYIKSSTKVITNDMIYDTRPTLAVGGYPLTHNQLQKRDEQNSHTIASITDLQASLDNKTNVDDVNNLLNQKADMNGTTSSTFTLNKDESGVPIEHCGISVGRGSLPTVSIKYNEDDDAWEYTNDGTTFTKFGKTDGSIAKATSFSYGTVKLSVDPSNEEDPVVVGDNDPRLLKIDNKVDESALNDYAKTADVNEKLLKKADLESVYTKEDTQNLFLTKAEYGSSTGTYSKDQVDSFLSLKANAASVYTKQQVESMFVKYYTQAEIDEMLKKISSGSGSGSLLNYYNKTEIDALLKQITDNNYTKTDIDGKLALKADTLSMSNQLSTKANLSDVYTKAEVDSKISNSGGTTPTTRDYYTKGETDAYLAGKAALSHNHLSNDITQDANHRLVTDDEITSWNNKQEKLSYIPENSVNKGTANGYASLDATGKIPISQLPAGIGTGTISNIGTTVTVNTYNDMIKLDTTTLIAGSSKVFVIDGTGDSTVKKGWAQYIYDSNKQFTKIAEQESMDLVLDWNNILNKPSSYPASTESLADYAQSVNVYTKTETDNLLTGKSDTNHNHNTLYYTQTQTQNLLNDKLNKSDIDLTKIHDKNVLGNYAVDETNIGNGKVLSFNSTTGKIEYVTVTSSGTGTVDYSKLGTKTVDESGLKNGNSLTYDAVNDKLIYSNIASKLGSAMVDETNIDNNKILVYKSATKTLNYESMPNRGTKDIDETSIGDGKVLTYNATSDKLVYSTPSSTSSSGGIYTYEASGSTGGACLVIADKKDAVKFTKSNNAATLTMDSTAHILSIKIVFTASDIGSGSSLSVDFNPTASDTDYLSMYYPTVTYYNIGLNLSSTMQKTTSINFNDNPHKVNITGLVSNQAVIVKLVF